jgi:putative Holliday junction resolvase
MKLMGIDYGRRRIGIAVTDETGTCIRGLGCAGNGDGKNPVTGVMEYINREKPEKIVFGLPLSQYGEETAMSTECRAFAAQIHEASGIETAFADEEFSSIDAHKLAMNHSKKKRRDKSLIDRLAACLILEQYQRECR